MITRSHEIRSHAAKGYSFEEDFILDFDSYVNSMDIFDYCFN